MDRPKPIIVDAAEETRLDRIASFQMQRKRPKPSGSVTAEVEFLSDRKCCICGRTDLQLHHLDGDPANNDIANLALLCLTHHHEATITSGIARKLSSETIRRYRSAHYERMERRRKAEGPRPAPRIDRGLEAHVAAIQVSEIRKIRAHLSFCEFSAAESHLVKLHDYWLCGPTAQFAILDALLPLTERTRFGVTPKLSSQIANLTEENLPIWSTWWRPDMMKKKLPLEDQAAYALAIQIGFALAYDGALYLKNLIVADDGARLLWRCLRVGWQFSNEHLTAEATREFDGAIDGATRGKFDEARRLLCSYRDQATFPDEGFPMLDPDLEAAIYSLRRAHSPSGRQAKE